MAEIPAGDAKLVQYLNEAYGLEARLETALGAHIAMTPTGAYKKRLQQHLTETKRHGREVKKRVKQLGGVPATIDTPGPSQVGEAAQAVLSRAQKAAALAQGPLHALRGTGEQERQLKNAKTEYTSESEEIATYTAIETLAELLGDKDTQRLARSIRREEERMRAYLEKEIPRLSKAVAKAEIPASQRKSAPGTRRGPSTRGRKTSQTGSSTRRTTGAAARGGKRAA
jgi:ferritin-like metal-binding protein YciE